jgi:ABC-type transport system involved in multi-copper enzyme maturation permease subunit
MSRISAVAWNTFREAVRDRVLYNLVFFALLLIATAILVGQISIGIEKIVLVSLGLSAISVIGLLIAVFTGVGLVSKEIEKRTLYALLAKPLRRWEFLVGKFGGLVLTLAVNTAAMAVGLLLALLYVKHSLERGDATVFIAVYFILLKLAIVVALALLFSCFTSQLLAILFTAGLYIAGLFVSEMRHLDASRIGPAMRHLFAAISYVLPNFQNFDVMAAAAQAKPLASVLILHNTLYATLYCAIALSAASVVFANKNLK